MSIVNDLRDAFRSLRRAPGFAVLAIAVLALGLGAGAAMFISTRALLLDAVPYPDAERLLVVSDRGPDGSGAHLAFGTFREVSERARTFQSAAVLRDWTPTLTSAAEPTRLDALRVSAAYFDTLGIRPAIGPGLAPEHDRPGGAALAVLSDSIWRDRFGASAGVVGSEAEFDGKAYRIVGVMPPGFRDVLQPGTQVWALLQYDASLPAAGREWGKHLRMVARLRADTTLDAARIELERIGASTVSAFARPQHADLARGLIVDSLQGQVTRSVRPGLLASGLAVGLLLLIACVNVANLTLARSAQRVGEFEARSALGASALRLMRQQLIEVLLLVAAAAPLGLWLAQLGLVVLADVSGLPAGAERPRAIDARAIAFSSATALLVAAAIAFVPMLRTARIGRRDSPHRHGSRVMGNARKARGALVVVEVALSLVLLVCAGLLMGSLQRLFSISSGFSPENLLSLQLHATGPDHIDDAAVERHFQRILETARGVPGVASAALTSQLPLSDDLDEFGVRFESVPGDVGEAYNALRYAVSPGYTETLGVPLRQGRGVGPVDTESANRVVVLSQSLARKQFGDRSPIGQRLRIGDPQGPWFTVVGVVGDIKQTSLASDQTDAVYVASTQWHFADRVRSLVVRHRGASGANLIPALREAIWSVDPRQPVSRIVALDDLIEGSATERRTALLIFSTFGLAALILASMGIYGVLAVHVAERTREIGLRMALGARPTVVARSLLGGSLILIGVGLVCGILLALGSTHVLQSLLFGITATDPATFLLAALTLGSIGLLACAVPLRQALTVDPAQALRRD